MQYFKTDTSIQVGYVGHDRIDAIRMLRGLLRAEFMVVALASDYTDAEAKAVAMARVELAEYIAGTKQLPEGVNRVVLEANDSPLGPRGDYELT